MVGEHTENGLNTRVPLETPGEGASAKSDDSGLYTVRVLAYLKEPERSAMGYERLAERHPGVEVNVASSFEEAEPWLEQADMMVTIGNHLGVDAAAIYRRAKKLKWVQSFGTGVDNIKGHPDLPENVVVTNIHGIHGPQLSEAAFAAMLSFARHIPRVIANQAEARWEKLAATRLYGKTVGILGLGSIANDLAPRCKAFGMTVIGITGTQRAVPGFDRIFTTSELKAAVTALDYCVVLTPLTEATRHIVNADVFKAMRASSVLINLSRGGVVDEQALLDALDAGELAGASLDVFEKEPLPATSPFWSHPRVLVTPHAAGLHAGYPEQAFEIVSNNVSRFLKEGVTALKNTV